MLKTVGEEGLNLFSINLSLKLIQYNKLNKFKIKDRSQNDFLQCVLIYFTKVKTKFSQFQINELNGRMISRLK